MNKNTTRNSSFAVKTVELSEKLVDQLLAANIRNRSESELRTNEFAKEMEDGTWNWDSPQGMTFIVNSSFNWLLDGQTRLMAIKNSKQFGHGCILNIVDDEKAEKVFETIDSGRVRTSGQTLGALGMRNATTISAICRTLLVEAEYHGTKCYVPQPMVNALSVEKEPIIKLLPITTLHVGVGRRFSGPMFAGALNAIRLGVANIDQVREFLVAALSDIGPENSATKNCSRYFQRLNGAGGSRTAGQRDQFAIVTKFVKLYAEGSRRQKIYLTDEDIEFARGGEASVWDIA